jgi:hypothetical protein
MKTSSLLKVNALALSIVLMFLASCDTEKNLSPADDDYFLKYYGGNGNQYGVDMIKHPDGSYLLLGNWETGENERRIYLVKVDLNGDIIWERKLGAAGSIENAKDIEPLATGDFIIVSDHHNGNNTDVKLIRITSEGASIDSVVFALSGNQVSSSVTPISDGGFIVTGTTSSTEVLVNPDANISDIFHYKISNTYGFDSIEWSKQNGIATVDYGTKVIEPTPGVFYVFGSSNLSHDADPTITAGKINLIYYELTSFGVPKAPSFLGDPDIDTKSAFLLPVPAALGSGFLFVGTETPTSSSINLHVSKLKSPLQFESHSDELFDSSLPIGSRKLVAVSSTASLINDLGYLLVANELQDDGSTNIWLSKINHATGALLWSARFGTEEENDQGAAAEELSDGKILLLGTVGLVNNQSKMVLMKLNSTGQLRD